jgi:hypothetical protein
MRQTETDVESLLSREKRARLPLRRQVLLYLDPFALFKDASSGPASVRQRALSYNRSLRTILVPYIRRWVLIAASLFVAIAPAEALAAEVRIFIIPAAAFAVGASIAVLITLLIAAVYLLLATKRE